MIVIEDLQKVVGGTTVLDIPNLTVPDGQIAALVGPAGSGKQLLLDLLTGRTHPSLGSLSLAGVDPAKEKERFSLLVGVLFADDTCYKHLSPLANLAFHARLRGLPEERARQALAMVGLSDVAQARLSSLSTSQLRRLDFGRAILHNPRVLLLVEPFARCDESTITLIKTLIRQQAGAQAAVLALASDATHFVNSADTLYELNQGRISEIDQQQLEPEERLPFKIPVRYEDKVILFNPADILFASADEGRAIIVTATGQVPTQYTLVELEARLARSGFFRAHRSYLVNLQHVREVIPYTRNSFTLRLNDQKQTEIPLSKSAASELKELLQY